MAVTTNSVNSSQRPRIRSMSLTGSGRSNFSIMMRPYLTVKGSAPRATRVTPTRSRLLRNRWSSASSEIAWIIVSSASMAGSESTKSLSKSMAVPSSLSFMA